MNKVKDKNVKRKRREEKKNPQTQNCTNVDFQKGVVIYIMLV